MRSAEWKVDKDSPTDLHRHLSHLVGLYPSYSIASYPEGGATAVMGLTRKALLDAAEESLRGRGDGKGPDADAGEYQFALTLAQCRQQLIARGIAFFAFQDGRRSGERPVGPSSDMQRSSTTSSRYCTDPYPEFVDALNNAIR